jgi:hypothetical protein
VLLTVQVELGGWLGERSWLRPFSDALGWVDAYVERMLMAVILVKDEVSQGAETCHRVYQALRGLALPVCYTQETPVWAACRVCSSSSV